MRVTMPGRMRGRPMGLTSRHAPRLPNPNCSGKLGATERFDNIQHSGECRSVSGRYALAAQMETDTVVAEHPEVSQQVPNVPARQIASGSDDDLIDPRKIGQKCLPIGVPRPNGRAVIIDVCGDHDAASVFDRLPKVAAKFHLSSEVTGGSSEIYGGTDHDRIEPRNWGTSTKLVHIFMPIWTAPRAIHRHLLTAALGGAQRVVVFRAGVGHRGRWTCC